MESEVFDISCVGIIMDGNRRWATDQGKRTLAGHKRGSEVFFDCAEWIRDAGIPHAVFYAFSTENWKRSEEEVSYLMDLFAEFLGEMDTRLNDHKDDAKKIRVRIVGRREDFRADLQAQMNKLEERTKEHSDTTIWVALSYGGRAEIIDAVNAAVAAGESVDEQSFNDLLWTGEMPDPDIIIRTSGEQRLSNFVTWKSVYSELFFTPTYWPAFTQAEFLEIVRAYQDRSRRKGV